MAKLLKFYWINIIKCVRCWNHYFLHEKTSHFWCLRLWIHSDMLLIWCCTNLESNSTLDLSWLWLLILAKYLNWFKMLKESYYWKSWTGNGQIIRGIGNDPRCNDVHGKNFHPKHPQNSLCELGFNLWRDIVIPQTRLQDTLLDFVHPERRGEVINRDLMRNIIKMLTGLGSSVYKEDFE